MAHEIYINKKNEASVFVVKEPAWHGLGQVVENALNAEEAIKEAHLDWEVVKTPIYYSSSASIASEIENDEIRENFLENDEKIVIPNKKATIRTDTNEVLGIVCDTYTPVQNREAFQFFDALVDEKEAIYHSAGVLGKGERIWLLAKLPTDIVVGKDDLINNYVLLFNSHNGSMGVTALITPIRVVCNNTLAVALRTATNKVVIRHTANVLEQLKEAHKVLGLSFKYQNEFQEAMNYLTTIKVGKEKTEQFLSKVFDVKRADGEIIERSLKAKKRILEVFEGNEAGQDMPICRGTAYGLFNAVTCYFDNLATYRSADSKAQSTWFGHSSEIRKLAFNSALALS